MVRFSPYTWIENELESIKTRKELKESKSLDIFYFSLFKSFKTLFHAFGLLAAGSKL